ncbi:MULTISPECIES: DeoR/GlpR family DNA-binding transcription regulator [Clostridia]|uniref:DeoR/GlpR family DNA-binding transcription regulator n=1 Tax=Clostridia TaxID=186801 RepID=UPI000EA292A4|nr:MULTISPECIES: DeoR/GlpR family DNA-binding transcription regulator [Clostridia]NBJ71486.1 DeoR/GlpR transcriptional regulator [Roseburia sp. 1XD42-34]RKI74347.1 DeoR/GlpR transcriptional regulator [Clostridium sp. 1xD42-85]
MKMFVTERRDKIINLLQEKKRVTVKELASEIGVSEATLRSDLNTMETEGLLLRTHGGAILNDETENDTSFNVRQKKNKHEKMKIANRALEMIEEKQCILLDASSTAFELAQLIKETNLRLTVVTTGLQTAMELKENPDITVILVGGVVTSKSTSIEGTLGIDILDSVNIDIMFTSANGFTLKKGLEDFNLYEVQLKREIVKRSAKVVALVDSSKIGTSSSAVFATFEQIDKVITDKPISHEIRNQLSLKNIEITVAE